jgi:hypothetical protein
MIVTILDSRNEIPTRGLFAGVEAMLRARANISPRRGELSDSSEKGYFTVSR